MGLLMDNNSRPARLQARSDRGTSPLPTHGQVRTRSSATGCADNSIRLWDLATFQEVAELRGHTAYVHALAWSPDGTRLVSGSGATTLRVWDSLPPAARNNSKK